LYKNVEIFPKNKKTVPFLKQTFLFPRTNIFGDSKIFFEIQTKLFLPSFHLFLYYYYYYYYFFFFFFFFFVCCQAFFNPNPDPVCIQTRVPVLKVYINVNTYGDIRLVPKGPKKRRKSKCSMRFLE
jgi:hypothetical protein